MKKKFKLLIVSILITTLVLSPFVYLYVKNRDGLDSKIGTQLILDKMNDYINNISDFEFVTLNTAGYTLTPGYYKLDWDYYYDTQITTDLAEDEEIYIDLNGHSLTYGGWANWEGGSLGTTNAAFYGTKGNIYILDSTKNSEEKERNDLSIDFSIAEGFDNIGIANINYQANVWRSLVTTEGNVAIDNCTVNDVNHAGADSIIAESISVSNSDLKVRRMVYNTDFKITNSTIDSYETDTALILHKSNGNVEISDSSIDHKHQRLIASYGYGNTSRGDVSITGSTIVTPTTNDSEDSMTENNILIKDSTLTINKFGTYGNVEIDNSTINATSKPTLALITYYKTDIKLDIKNNSHITVPSQMLYAGPIGPAMYNDVSIIDSTIELSPEVGGGLASITANNLNIVNTTMNVNKFEVNGKTTIDSSNITATSGETSLITYHGTGGLDIKDSTINSSTYWLYITREGNKDSEAKIVNSTIMTNSSENGRGLTTSSIMCGDLTIDNTTFRGTFFDPTGNVNITNNSNLEIVSDRNAVISYPAANKTVNVTDSVIKANTPLFLSYYTVSSAPILNVDNSTIELYGGKSITSQEGSIYAKEITINNSNLKVGDIRLYGDLTIKDSTVRTSENIDAIISITGGGTFTLDNSTLATSERIIDSNGYGIINNSTISLIESRKSVIGSGQSINIAGLEVKESNLEVMRNITLNGKSSHENNAKAIIEDSEIVTYLQKGNLALLSSNGSPESSCTVKNTTITNDKNNGIFAAFETLTLDNTTVKESSHDFDIIYFAGACRNVFIKNNSNIDVGGNVIGGATGTVEITDSTINTIGGEMIVQGPNNLTIKDSTITQDFKTNRIAALTGNTVNIDGLTFVGGPIASNKKDITIANSDIEFKSKDSNFNPAGITGIHNDYGSIKVTNSKIHTTYNEEYESGEINLITADVVELDGVTIEIENIDKYYERYDNDFSTINSTSLTMKNSDYTASIINGAVEISDSTLNIYTSASNALHPQYEIERNKITNEVVSATPIPTDLVLKGVELNFVTKNKDIVPFDDNYISYSLDDTKVDTNTDICLRGRINLDGNISLKSVGDFQIYDDQRSGSKIGKRFKAVDTIKVYHEDIQNDLYNEEVFIGDEIFQDRKVSLTNLYNVKDAYNDEVILKYSEGYLYWTDFVKITYITIDGETVVPYFKNDMTEVLEGKDVFVGKNKYVFKRWNSKQDGTGDDYTTGFKITSNKTYYAIYDIVPYSCFVCESKNIWDESGKEISGCTKDEFIDAKDKCVIELEDDPTVPQKPSDKVTNPKTGLKDYSIALIVLSMVFIVYKYISKVSYFKEK